MTSEKNKLQNILTKAFILYNCEIQLFTLLALQTVKLSGHDYWFNWKEKKYNHAGAQIYDRKGAQPP